MRSLVILCLCTLGCGRIPPHLQVNPPVHSPTSRPESVDITSRTTALASLTVRDPLVRGPRLPDRSELEGIEGTRPISDWISKVQQIERMQLDAANTMQQLELKHGDSEALALSRGYRLRKAENLLANSDNEGQPLRDAQVADLLTPLRQTQPAPETESAFGWMPLGGTSVEIRSYGERWVLQGWLSSPSIPLEPVATALQQGTFTKLAGSDVGRLIVARAEQQSSTDVEVAWDALEKATYLSLVRAGADRDSEQGEWADLRATWRDKTHSEKPIESLLKTARDGLIRDASTNASAGGAILAIAALRWLEVCDDTVCQGLDRSELMTWAGRWSPEVDRLARVWKVIAAKDAIDTMDVGHDTIMFRRASIQLVDVMIGAKVTPLERQLVQRKVARPATWLALTRPLGEDGITNWKGARDQLGALLVEIVKDASLLSHEEEVERILNRIERRAIP